MHFFMHFLHFFEKMEDSGLSKWGQLMTKKIYVICVYLVHHWRCLISSNYIIFQDHKKKSVKKKFSEKKVTRSRKKTL